jgi:ribosome-associated protein
MDIRKLQRAIVDGLEDVKAQNIVVFNTEHLSPLFERVIIASGTSNRQTKALASSVRDAVKQGGMQVLRTEGEDNGEWIIVDCGAAVAHIMQPAIREYYHLEEIWGEKPVKLKLGGAAAKGLPKASGDGLDTDEDEAQAAAPATPHRSATARTAAGKAATHRDAVPAGKKAAAKQPAAKKTAPAKAPAARKAPARKAAAPAERGAARGAPAKQAPARSATAKSAAGKSAAAKRPATGKAPVKSAGAPARKAAAKKPAAR